MKHGWEYKKIKDVCTKKSSNLQQNKIVELTGDYPVFGASGFVQNIDTYQQEKPYIGIVKDGSGVGRVNIYPAKSSLLGTMQYIIPNNNINLGYVAYCLQSLKLSKFSSGAAIPHIYFRDYGETYIPVPPLPVQEQICSLLDKMNRVIEAKKEQLKELDNLAQAIFYDMFGDPVTNEKGWNIIALNDAVHSECPISYGIVQPEEDVKGGVPIVRPIDFRENTYVKRNGLKCTSLEISNAYKRTILRGDELLFCVRGTTGTIGIATRELKGCNVTRGIVPLFFCEKVKRAFAYYVLLHPSTQQLIQEKTNGIALRQINIKDLRSLPIITPSPTLQQAFAEKVEAIERQKELINQSLREVQTLFDSRMDYWFSEEDDDFGQLDKLD